MFCAVVLLFLRVVISVELPDGVVQLGEERMGCIDRQYYTPVPVLCSVERPVLIVNILDEVLGSFYPLKGLLICLMRPFESNG